MPNMKHVTFDERLKQLETDLEKKNSLNRELLRKKGQFGTKSASMELTCNDLMVVVRDREKTEKMQRCKQVDDMNSVDSEWRNSLELNAKRMSEQLEAEREAFRINAQSQMNILNMIEAELESIRIGLERQKINDKNEIEKQREELQQNMNILSIQREELWQKEVEMDLQRESINVERKETDEVRNELKLVQNRLMKLWPELRHQGDTWRLDEAPTTTQGTMNNQMKAMSQLISLQKRRESSVLDEVAIGLRQSDFEAESQKLAEDRKAFQFETESIRLQLQTRREGIDSERNQIEREREKLEAERKDLKAKDNKLEFERKQLSSAVDKLVADRLEFEHQKEEDVVHRKRELQQHLNADIYQMDEQRKQLESEVDKLGMERNKLQNEIEVQRERIEEERNELKLEKDIMAREQRIIHLERAKLEKENDKLMRSKQDLESQRNILGEDQWELVHQNEQINAMTRTEIGSQETGKVAMDALRLKLQNEAFEIKKEREHLLREKEAIALRYIETEAAAQKLDKERQEFRRRAHELDSVRVELHRKDKDVRLWLMAQSEQQEKLRGHEQFQIRNLMSALAELWELFDESHHLAKEVRMRAAAKQLDQIRGEWIRVTQTMMEFVGSSQATHFNTA